MSRPAADIADKVRQRARGVDVFVSKLEGLARTKQLTGRDVERAYTGAFLAFFGFYEASWENLFFGLLMQRLSHPRPVQPLVAIRSESVARHVVLGNQAYLKWFPVKNTTDRAAIFLSSGRPFSELTDTDKGALSDYVVIRNALAHDSRNAMAKFKKQIVGQRALPPAERSPAGYLRGSHTINQTRMNLAMSDLSNILGRLCS